MKIHPRHFNKFMVVFAIIAIVIIIYGTFAYRQNREEIFRQNIANADSLQQYSFPNFFGGDSLQIQDFKDKYVLLDIWASWASQSTKSHEKLSAFQKEFKDRLQIVAASVKDDSLNIKKYREKHQYSFHFVDGTHFYNRMNIAGIPSQLLFNPEGKVIGIFIGYTDSTRYDSLRALIQNE